MLSSTCLSGCHQPAPRPLSFSLRRSGKVSIDGRPHEVDGVFDARLDKDDDVFQEVDTNLPSAISLFIYHAEVLAHYLHPKA